MPESNSLAADTLQGFACSLNLCNFVSETVSAFEVNDFLHPESDHLFSCGLPIKINRWSLDLLMVNSICPFECNLVKVPCHGHFGSPKNVGSNFTYF